ncbi:DNA-methyltransferase [Rhodoluna limnophila]|uniref:DNA-methyltransferase n=1 Tax=Rhodoluna limnophila TaxID=232537 RepID=UPI0011067001|nr:site-specific DNA-methyltransferase [Rhodoluna limnophila]
MSKALRVYLDKDGVERAIFHQLDVLAFLKSLPDASVDIFVTDPAYSGMNQHLSLGKGRIVGDYSKDKTGKWFEEFHDTPANYEAFLNECNRVLKPNSHIFVMFDSFSMLTLGPIFRQVFNLKNVLTWDKVSIGMGHYFRRRSEFILFGSKGKKPISRRDIPDIWALKRVHNPPYPTQKPVELFMAMLASSFQRGDDFVACDPFSGSGSAAIAAIKLGGRFIGNDISDKALDLIHQRITSVLETGDDPFQPKPATVEGGLRAFWDA